MNEQTNSNITNLFGDDAIDIGGGDLSLNHDPFAEDAAPKVEATPAANIAQAETTSVVAEQPVVEEPTQEAPATPEPAIDNPMAQAMAAAETKGTGTAAQTLQARAPQFVYAGATEDIADASITFEELRIAKATDFPELEDGKRVSWTVEYGKITKAVSDPNGTSIAKMKEQIEQSKEFADSLKKIKLVADREAVTCKVKPQIKAQSKGECAYKGIFTTLDDAVSSGKIISIIPARDGLVYERRTNEIGTFITPTRNVPELSEVTAGFTPALPRISINILRKTVAFFRYFMQNGKELEALVHIIWDKKLREYKIVVPKQSVSKISVSATLEQEYNPERYIHVMDIHSHNSMAAKFSSIDNADEKATRIYAVIGRLDRFLPEISVRISNGGKYHNIHPSEIFEEIDGSIPEAWTHCVQTKREGC
jgi:hypothetical protein